MKKFKVFSMVLILLLCGGLFAGCGSNDPSADVEADSEAAESYASRFSIENTTGVEITKICVSPVDADDWTENILEQASLPDGDVTSVFFEAKEGARYWDMMATDAEGNQLIFKNLSLTNVLAVKLRMENGEPTATGLV